MTCSVLTLINETFGAPFPVQTGTFAQFRRFVDVALPATSTGIASTQVGGRTIFAQRAPTGEIGLTIESQTVNIQPRSPASSLRAAVLRSGTRMIVVNDDGNVANREVEIHVVPLTAGGNLLKLGPYKRLPGQVALNVSDNWNSQLLLIWHDLQSNGTGKQAYVARTDVQYSGSDRIVSGSNDNATNLVACTIVAATRSFTLIGGATLAGPDNVALPTAANRVQITQADVAAGLLRVAPNSVTFSDDPMLMRRNVIITNAGQDMLELKAVSQLIPPPTGPVTLELQSSLPVCMAPRQEFQIDIVRMSPSAAQVTFEVTSVPPGDSQERKVKVSLAATGGAPMLVLSSNKLSWRTGNVAARSLGIRNRGNIPLIIQATPAAQGFSWTSDAIAPSSAFRLAPGAVVGLSVTPPAAQAMSSIDITAKDEDGQTMQGSPFSVALESGVAGEVNAGDVRIGTWQPDPPGSDIFPEGEFIELDNVSGRDLNLTGVAIKHTTFASATATGGRVLFKFEQDTFGPSRLLPAGKSVRILTRAKAATDPMDDFPAGGTWRVYANKAAAVWNNRGDVATLVNADGAVIDVRRFERVAPGTTTTTTTVNPAVESVPQRQRTRVPGLSRRIFVNGKADFGATIMVEDDDLLVIRDMGGTVQLGGPFAGSCGPAGKPGAAAPVSEYIPWHGDMFYPLPGAPGGCLLARISEGGATRAPVAVAVGAPTFTLAVRANNFTGNAPMVVEFGINDCFIDDNAGEFEAFVDVYR